MLHRAEPTRPPAGRRRLAQCICLLLACAAALCATAGAARAAAGLTGTGTAPAHATPPAAAATPATRTISAPASTTEPGGPVAPPKLGVTAADLVVAGTGEPLYGVHPEAEHAIASTTKLMTALITLRHVHDLNRVFTQMNWTPAADDSQIGLAPGERMTVRDLMLALLIPSADDAAMDLAYNVGGHSVARFLAMMNAEARKLGLTHTHYTTPTGLDTPGNYSTAADLTTLGDYDMRHLPFFRRAVAMTAATLTSGRYVRHIVTTDTLLGQYPWIHGIKTGHTNDAGYVLVSQGTRDGMTLTAAVLGTDSEEARNDNALALLNYGFANFHRVEPLRRGQDLVRLPVAYSDGRAQIIAGGGYATVVPRDTRVQVALPRARQLTGPLAKGTVVGHARVFVGRREVAVIPMELAHRLPKVSAVTKVTRFLGRSSTLLVLALIAFAVAGAVSLSRYRRRTRPVVPARRVRQR